MPKKRFTTRWAKTVEIPTTGQVDYIDYRIAGFTLRVTPAGVKTWTICYRFHGRRRRFVLGRFPSVSLSEARKRALNVLAQVSGEIDPAAVRDQNARDGTFNELRLQYMLRHAQPIKKSWKHDQWMIDRHLMPRWKHIKVRDITRPDVRAIFESLADRPVLANRLLALISRIFTFAISRDWRPDNPARGVEKNKEQSRSRVLTSEEIRAIWKVLSSEDPFHEALFKLRFLTGARGNEVRTMRWTDVCFKSRLWTIPASNSKNKREHVFPLTDDAVSVLQRLSDWQQRRLDDINTGRRKKNLPPKLAPEWVFASPRGDDHFRWEQRAAARIREKASVDFAFHDVRRTVATGLTEHCGVDRFLLKKLLNHVDRDISGVYDRNTYDKEKRFALETWGRRLTAIIEGRDTSKVVTIRSSRR